jgi:hypothetical protein
MLRRRTSRPRRGGRPGGREKEALRRGLPFPLSQHEFEMATLPRVGEAAKSQEVRRKWLGAESGTHRAAHEWKLESGTESLGPRGQQETVTLYRSRANNSRMAAND